MKSKAFERHFYNNAVLMAALNLIFTKLADADIPLSQLQEIANTTSGGTPDRRHSEYYDGQIPWIKSGELNDGFIEKYEESITEEGLKNSSAKIYPKGTLVVALYGATVGKTGILSFDAASNQAVCAIIPKTNLVNTKYLFWFLRYKRADFVDQSFGGAQPNISQKVLRETSIPIPTLELQDIISDYLESIEQRQKGLKTEIPPDLPSPLTDIKSIVARIEELARKIEEAKGLKKEGVAETNGIFPSSINEIWHHTDKWKKKAIGDLATVVSGLVDPTVEPYASLPHINGEAIESGTCKLLTYRLAKDDVVKSGKFHFSQGSILYSKIRPYLKKAVQVPVEGICSADVYAFNYIDPVLEPRFFMYSLVSPQFTEYANDLSGRTRMPKLNQNQLFAYELSFPPLSEQRRIVEYLDNLQTRVDTLKRRQAETEAELNALLPSILDKAFKGEL